MRKGVVIWTKAAAQKLLQIIQFPFSSYFDCEFSTDYKRSSSGLSQENLGLDMVNQSRQIWLLDVTTRAGRLSNQFTIDTIPSTISVTQID